VLLIETLGIKTFRGRRPR